MDDMRQQTQYCLAFEAKSRGEAPRVGGEGTESSIAKCETESPASHEQWLLLMGLLNQPNRRVRTRTHGGVTGKAREGLPMSMCAGHVQQLGGESPLANLMEVKA